MEQKKERNRVFLIPEASYDERTENLASMYWMLKMIIDMTRRTGELAMNDRGVKRSFKWLLKRCDKFDAFADLILKEEAIPRSYADSKDRAELEDKKSREIFLDGILDGGPDEDDDDDDDYGDVYNAGFCFDDDDGEGELTHANIEQLTDEVFALREEATDCVVGASDVIKNADELLEALEEIRRRLNR